MWPISDAVPRVNGLGYVRISVNAPYAHLANGTGTSVGRVRFDSLIVWASYRLCAADVRTAAPVATGLSGTEG